MCIRRTSARYVGWRLVLLAVCLNAAIGCSRSRSASEAEATIRLGLNWIPDAQHAGFYAADVRGLFDRAGLSVRIVPGGPGVPIVQNVALRKLDFAVANADQVLMARAQGVPVIAVLASMQTSPRCIMVHRQSGIQSLHELRDVTLALGAGKAFAKYLQTHLELTNVKVVPYTGSIALFMEDPRFAQQAYVFSEPYVVRQKGADPLTLLVSELGFDPYTSCLITHEEMIKSHREQVRQLVRAVRQGWWDYFQDPQPVHARIVAANPQMDTASLEFGMRALQPLVLPPGQDPQRLGDMDPSRWQQLCEQLIELGLLPEGTDPTTAYTRQFIEPLEAVATPSPQSP